MLKTLYHTHRFFTNQLLYPMMLSSGLAVSLYAGRFYLSHSWTYRFLIWNLFLAWIPYLCSLWAAHLHRNAPGRWWAMIVPGAIWFIFFPNAPYLVTDFVHLAERPPTSFWYDLSMLATFAWTGCLLAIASLIVMPVLGISKKRIARQMGSRALEADALETMICAYLSFALLLGLALNALAGWWWADPLAALIMVPYILKEGWEAVKEARESEPPL